jgi:hypothetical protein
MMAPCISAIHPRAVRGAAVGKKATTVEPASGCFYKTSKFMDFVRSLARGARLIVR